MQELFPDKMHSFKFLPMRDKPGLDLLKIITVLFLVVQASLGEIQFHWYKKGEIPCAKNNYEASTTYQAH